MSHAFSAAVKLADLDDFLSPAQSCILPLLDSKGGHQNVGGNSGDDSVATAVHSSTRAREASVRPSVSHPTGYRRTRKTTIPAAKQEITRPSSFSSVAAEAPSAASSPALPDGANVDITVGTADTLSGMAFQQVLSGNEPFSEESSGKQGTSVPIGGDASSSTYARPSLIKLGQSRLLKENSSDSSSSSSRLGAGDSKKTISYSTSSAFSSEVSPGPPAVASAAGQDTKQVARVALYDCLACKGCVTSSEAILIERHSIDEFLRRTGAAISSPSSTVTREKDPAYAADSVSATVSAATVASIAASAGDKVASTAEGRKNLETEAQRPADFAEDVSAAAGTQESNDVLPRLVVVSISPQSLTALQQHFDMKSAAVTLRKLSSLFRLAGATHVLHTAVGDALSVLEVEREFINRCREAGIGQRKDAAIRETKAAPAAGLRDETRQQEASDTAAASESQITEGVAATGIEAAAGIAEAVGVDAAELGGAREHATGIAVAGVPAAGVTAGEKERPCLMPGIGTADRASGRSPEEQTTAREIARPCSTEHHSKEDRSCCSAAGRSSDVKNSLKREDGNGRFAELSAGVSASAAAVTGAERQQQQKGERQQEQQQQQRQGDRERNQRRQPEEQQQPAEQQQQNWQQPQIQQQRDRQKGYREVSSVSSPSDGKAAESSVLPLLASFCPGFVCYAETSYDAPLLLQHMSRVRSGQQIQGILVKGLLLELHNAASFLLRSAALTAAFCGTGVPPLLLQLLLRKSAYASPRCLEAAQSLQRSAGERRKQKETTDIPYAFNPHSTAAAAVPRPGAADASSQIKGLREKLKDTLQHEQWTQHGPANSSVTNMYKDVLSLEGRSLGPEENIRPEDVFHVCIMPCFDKKLEAARPEFRHPTSRAAAVSMAAESAAAASMDATPDAAGSVTAAAPAAAAASAFTGGAASVSGGRREPVELPSGVKEGEFESPDASRRNKSSNSGVQDDVTVADVDLVLATNEVPVLLQRMNVLFEELPETHVDTLLDDFFPLRNRITRAALLSGVAAAAVGGGAPGTGALERNKKEEAATSCWRSKGAVASASASDLFKGKAALMCSSSVERMSNFGCISSAVSLLPRLRSLMLSPFQLLLHPAAAITPYLSLNSRWRWCRTSSFDNAINSAIRPAADHEEDAGRAGLATTAIVSTVRERPLAVCNTDARLPSECTNVLETLHATVVERELSGFTGSVKVRENRNYFQAVASGCFISTEQMCGSGGYAERVFRRAAKELFELNVEGPLIFQKRKKGDEGYKETVLVIDGEEKLRVALAYGFKNIQNVVQKLKRQRRLATQPAAVAAPADIEQQNTQMQSKKKQREQRQQEEQKQQQERQRTLRLPHFLEFAACPGGCLCGGGQKLETFKNQSVSSSSCAHIASSTVLATVSSSTAAASTLRKGNNVEHMQDGSEAVAQQRREELDLESNNASFSGRKSSNNVFVEENEFISSSGKCVSYPASVHVSAAALEATNAAAEQKPAPGATGQAKPVETLTRLLHDSHVYCDPLQRVEVQLAYLYLLCCAKRADKKRQQGQRTAKREAETRQKQQRQRQHTQVRQEQQPEHPQELIDQVGNVHRHEKTLQPQQSAREDDQVKLTWREEAQEQEESHSDQPQQEKWREKDRETKRDARTDGIRAREGTTGIAEIHAASLCVSTAGTRTAGKSAGSLRNEGLTCFLPLLCGVKTLSGCLFVSIPGEIRERSAARGTVTDSAAATAGAAFTESTVISQATNATGMASTKATEMVQASPASAWWDAFGENKTAVKLLRTRFRDVWGGKKEQSQKGDAAEFDVNFSSPPAQHRVAGAKPSLHW